MEETARAEVSERFIVTLRALPGWNTPATNRLKALLKYSLRPLGMRCADVRELTDAQASPATHGDDAGQDDIATSAATRQAKP